MVKLFASTDKVFNTSNGDKKSFAFSRRGINMFFVNEKMTKEILSIDKVGLLDKKVREKAREFENKIFPNVKLIDDLIIFDPNNKFSLNNNHYLQNKVNLSVLEYDSNEIRLGDYINVEDVPQLLIALNVIKDFKNIFKKKFPDRQFCIYLNSQYYYYDNLGNAIDDFDIEKWKNNEYRKEEVKMLQFHTFREEHGYENGYILSVNNLDDYLNEAILVGKF